MEKCQHGAKVRRKNKMFTYMWHKSYTCFIMLSYYSNTQNKTVHSVTWLDDQDFFHSHYVQSTFGNHPACYPRGTRGSFLVSKEVGG